MVPYQPLIEDRRPANKTRAEVVDLLRRVDGFGRSTVTAATYELNDAAENRLHQILDRAIARVLKRLENNATHSKLAEYFSNTIKKHICELIEAAKAPPSIQRALDEIRERGKEERRLVADELKRLQDQLEKTKAELEQVSEILRATEETGLTLDRRYLPIPPPVVEVNTEGEGLPAISGIYFIWSNSIVVYVGQSTNICNRVRLSRSNSNGGHHAIEPGNYVSWIPEIQSRLNHTEAFYIGLTRAQRNFGWHRGKRKYAD